MVEPFHNQGLEPVHTAGAELVRRAWGVEAIHNLEVAASRTVVIVAAFRILVAVLVDRTFPSCMPCLLALDSSWLEAGRSPSGLRILLAVKTLHNSSKELK